MNMITFYYLMLIFGAIQNEPDFTSNLNTNEVEFSKYMYSIILQCIVIIIFYDFNLVEFGRILYIGFTIIFITVLFFNIFTSSIQTENNITNFKLLAI